MKRFIICAVLISIAVIASTSARTRGCGPIFITQDDIPYQITKNGRYHLCEDVQFNGTGSDSAITIEASNVQLILEGHSITLQGSDIFGIKVSDVSEILISNDSIQTDPSFNNGTAIQLSNTQKVQLSNLCISNSTLGLQIIDSTDVYVYNCSFSHCDDGMRISRGNSITLDHTTINHSVANGLVLRNAKDLKIFKSSFFDAGDILVSASNDCANFLVKDSSFTQTTTLTNFSVLDLRVRNLAIDQCSFTCATGVSNAIMQYGRETGLSINSSLFEAPSSTNNCIDLDIGSSSILIRGCTINGSPASSGIALTSGNASIQETVIKNCLNGIHLRRNSEGISIDRCTINNNLGNGILIERAHYNAVTNNSICKNAANGILLTAASVFGNVIKNNTVADNTLNGISLEGADSNTVLNNEVCGNIGNGIVLNNSSLQNSVQYNRVHNNVGIGIFDNDLSFNNGNQIYYNTSHTNTGLEYSIDPATTFIQAQGDTTLEASNINGDLPFIP